jgi:hypothetical protein
MGAALGLAQGVPATPRKFATRSIGGHTVTGGATVEPGKGAAKVRHITYGVLSESRNWTSTEGKVLVGRLIAFEDMVVEFPKGAEAPPAPLPPAHPTVLRDGKVRLLVNQKACEVLLERLVQADRDFIEQVRAVRERAK